jgi:hypothetical protein
MEIVAQFELRSPDEEEEKINEGVCFNVVCILKLCKERL